MKKYAILYSLLIISTHSFSQDYTQWPADKPQISRIQNSQSRTIRQQNRTLPQVMDMQDKMRRYFTDQMREIAQKLGWPMVELDEFTTDGNVYHMDDGSIVNVPYNLCPPGQIFITFQFIANRDSLAAWKKYQTEFQQVQQNRQEQSYNSIQAITQSSEYKQYQDSANYYMNLYTTYVEKHKDEGVALYTKDEHPKFYQQKESQFIDKMTTITEGKHEQAGIDQLEARGANTNRRFMNQSVVAVTIEINNTNADPVDQTLGPVSFTSKVYPKENTTLSKIFTIPENQENGALVKWDNIIMLLSGKFKTIPNNYGQYVANFMDNGQSDLYTPKRIKCDKVQNIDIMISGSQINIKKFAALIDMGEYNSFIFNK